MRHLHSYTYLSHQESHWIKLKTGYYIIKLYMSCCCQFTLLGPSMNLPKKENSYSIQEFNLTEFLKSMMLFLLLTFQTRESSGKDAVWSWMNPCTTLTSHPLNLPSNYSDLVSLKPPTDNSYWSFFRRTWILITRWWLPLQPSPQLCLSSFAHGLLPKSNYSKN